jgi:hypothetical protein
VCVVIVVGCGAVLGEGRSCGRQWDVVGKCRLDCCQGGYRGFGGFPPIRGLLACRTTRLPTLCHLTKLILPKAWLLDEVCKIRWWDPKQRRTDSNSPPDYTHDMEWKDSHSQRRWTLEFGIQTLTQAINVPPFRAHHNIANQARQLAVSPPAHREESRRRALDLSFPCPRFLPAPGYGRQAARLFN